MNYSFEQIARICEVEDNVAIVTKELEAGTRIRHAEQEYTLSHTILEGHRFAFKAIKKDELILSWGLPFGIALKDIKAGEYICNEKVIESLSERHVDFELPEANFENYYKDHQITKENFLPGTQVERYDSDLFFEGFAREDNRGVGTRNYVILLGTSSKSGSFVDILAKRFIEKAKDYPNVDGVVAIKHTEAGEDFKPNNINMILRALAGWVVHPNVASVLAVDSGDEYVNNKTLQNFLNKENYPAEKIPLEYFSLQDAKSVSLALDTCSETVEQFLKQANQSERTKQSVSNLKIALQCGGSDAFSGVSGNPLAAWVAKEIIKYGGAAGLAETTELVGAEPYILNNTRDFETAQAFLDKIERYNELAGWHGQSAASNPSGGNIFRGLYNIAIKSIGAARKKAPDVCLDYVIDYGMAMDKPGFYFMDSPGNDLESIAGQVASGCNFIFFITGNGSITNFPFVPTSKIVTTTDRYKLIKNEMDVNAGEYLDGTSLDDLGKKCLEHTLRIVSGEKSVGEIAGHAQVQIWRDWRQTDSSNLDLRYGERPSGDALACKQVQVPNKTFNAYCTENAYSSNQVALVMPTSLCSGQIAKIITKRLNEDITNPGISRFVTLTNTEGCGTSGEAEEIMFKRTLFGSITNPLVKKGLFLEHGCEKTHNDAFRNTLTENNTNPEHFGWASVQLDGGIEKVSQKVVDWFKQNLNEDEIKTEDVGLEHLKLGLCNTGEVNEEVAETLSKLAAIISSAGGLIVISDNASLLKTNAFKNILEENTKIEASICYAEQPNSPGLHVMQTHSNHHVETITGLGATGVEIILSFADGILQTHPMIPVLQTSTKELSDIDYVIDSNSNCTSCENLLDLVLDTASRRYTPKLHGQGYEDFQLTRGLFGIST